MNRRIAIVLFLTLLPWPAVWFGMYKLSSIPATFFLYHGVCLLPAVIANRKLWWHGFHRPTVRQWLALFVASFGLCVVGYFSYKLTGTMIVERDAVLEVLTSRGYDARWLLPMAVYFIIVNATMEELFWRGVVLNELKFVDEKWRLFGIGWTAVTFAAWHYIVIRLLVRPPWAELVILSLVAMGFFTSWLYRKYDSILLPILWHALVFDLMVIVVFVALVAT